MDRHPNARLCSPQIAALAALTALALPACRDPGPGTLVDPNPGPALPDNAAWVAKPSGTMKALNGVWVSPSVDVVVAVGDEGAIVVSADRGETWKPSSSGVTAKLRGVWGSGDDDIYAVGDSATILRSADAGSSWVPRTLGESTGLRCVWGSGPLNVFVGAEDAHIYRSRDEGKRWRELPTTAITAVVGLWGTSSTDLFAVASSSLLSSNTSGDSVSSIFLSLAQQTGVWAASTTDVYAVNTAGVVNQFKGTDMISATVLVPTQPLFGVWGSGAADVYVVGGGGRISHTKDQGMDYVGQASGTAETLNAVHGAGGVVFAVGTAGTILKRSADVLVDGGAPDGAADATTD